VAAVGCQNRLAGRVSVEEYVAQLALLAWGRDRWMARSKRVWAAWGLFGDEIAVFVKGMYVELFICC